MTQSTPPKAGGGSTPVVEAELRTPMNNLVHEPLQAVSQYVSLGHLTTVSKGRTRVVIRYCDSPQPFMLFRTGPMCTTEQLPGIALAIPPIPLILFLPDTSMAKFKRANTVRQSI